MIGKDAIRTIDLTKAFDGLPVLQRVQLQVTVGESIAIMGANGAGKTTLLQCLAGIARWDEGELWWHGELVKKRGVPNHHPFHRPVGLIAHACQLYPNLTLLENLLFAARMTRLPQPRRQALEWLGRISLQAYADWFPGRISHGMRRRVSIARGLIHQPSVILMDEPFSGLDEEGRAWLADLLAELQRQQKSICFTTHDRHQADRCADRVLFLRHGTLQESTATQEPAHKHAQRLIA